MSKRILRFQNAFLLSTLLPFAAEAVPRLQQKSKVFDFLLLFGIIGFILSLFFVLDWLQNRKK